MNFSPGKFVLCLFILAALCPAAGFARGSKDDALTNADNLISGKHYDEAINALVNYARSNPDNFDDAQKRMRQIMLSREYYNSIANVLLDVLNDDPGNVEEVIRLITELTELEQNPNPSIQEFIENVRDVAVYTQNRNTLDSIMTKALALSRAGQYNEALAVYAGGFSIYREEFRESDIGEIVINLAEREADLAEDAVRRTEQVEGGLEAALQRLEAAAGALTAADGWNRSRAASYEAAWEEARALLVQLMELRNIFGKGGEFFNNQVETYNAGRETPDYAIFPVFAARVILGRDADPDGGMLGVLETLWEAASVRAEKSLTAVMNKAWNEALAVHSRAGASGAREVLAAAGASAKRALDALSLENLREGAEIPPFIEIAGEKAAEARAADFVAPLYCGIAVSCLEDTQDKENRFDVIVNSSENARAAWIANNVDFEMNIELSAELREQLEAFGEVIQGEINRITALQQGLLALTEETGAKPSAVPYLDAPYSYYTNFLDKVRRSRDSMAYVMYAFSNRALEREYGAMEGEFTRAETLLDGQTIQDGEAAYIAKYPREAEEILAPMLSALGKSLENSTKLLDRYDGETGEIVQDPEFLVLKDAALLTDRRLRDLAFSGRSRSGEAIALVNRAESLEADGNRLYEEARTAFAGGRYEAAKENLLRAQDRWDSSLGIQESAALRRSRDSRTESLGAEIARFERETIIREVRALVREARTEYFNSRFEEAENRLIRAQNRWRIISAEDEPEVANWLRLVQSALAFYSGRTVPVTAPLYPEMSQILSRAHLSYNEGLSLVNAGQRENAAAFLQSAEKHSEEVRLAFPLNEEAGLLQLRVDQVTDPAAFNANFDRRMREAAGLVRDSRSAEAYATLQNLYIINPRFPGLQAIIYEAEIALGIRMPPPAPADLQRSTELAASARSLINTNSQASLTIAVEQLNQALVLNPNNEEASALKEQAQLRMGSGSVAMSSAAQREYLRAIQELQQGNTVRAFSIVQQLLTDPRNQSSSKLLELRRRIESVL